MILGNTNKSKIYHKTNSRKNFKRESMDFQKFWALAKLTVPWPHSPWQSLDLWFLGHGVLSFSASLDTMSLRGLIYYHSLNLISMKITPTLLSISLNSLLRVVHDSSSSAGWFFHPIVPFISLFQIKKLLPHSTIQLIFYKAQEIYVAPNVHIHFNIVSHRRQHCKILVF